MRDINSLTAETTSYKVQKRHLPLARPLIEDPVIRRLQRNIVTISMQFPGSFPQNLKLRSETRDLVVREVMTAFWITIDACYLQNPLSIILAGGKYFSDSFPIATAAIRQAVATSNPAAVAQFSHHTCKAIQGVLLATNSGGTRILGDVLN